MTTGMVCANSPHTLDTLVVRGLRIWGMNEPTVRNLALVNTRVCICADRRCCGLFRLCWCNTSWHQGWEYCYWWESQGMSCMPFLRLLLTKSILGQTHGFWQRHLHRPCGNLSVLGFILWDNCVCGVRNSTEEGLPGRTCGDVDAWSAFFLSSYRLFAICKQWAALSPEA